MMGKWAEVNAVATAMAKMNGSKIDDMRPSTGNKWRYQAEVAIKALDEFRAAHKA